MSGSPPPIADETAATATLSRDEGGIFEFDHDARSPKRGDEIGHFTILEKLGAGGMGVVFAAYDVALNRKVAIKLLRVAFGSDHTTGRARLMREAQAMAQVDHPNVVTVYEVGRHHDDVYIAMEFIDGETFGAWRARVRPDWRATVDVLGQAARGLIAAHSSGLVHRDFKPDNVMVGTDGRIRVMDFGLVRANEPSRASASTSPPADFGESGEAGPDQSLEATMPAHGEFEGLSGAGLELTKAGAMLGTPAYMAPEQFKRTETDTRSDQFSFCVTLWEALFDERPFPGDSVLSLGLNVTEGRRKPTPKSPPVPNWLVKVCDRGLATDPEGRHVSMQALLDALDAGRRHARRRLIYAGVGVVALGSVGAWAGQSVSTHRQIQACDLAGDAIGEVWNADARATLERALAPLGEADASQAVATASDMLDDLSRRWSRARTGVCRQHRVERVWSDALAERAEWCLRERQLEMATTLETVTRATDPATLRQTVPALSEIHGIEGCLDEATLRARPLPPEAQRSAHAARRQTLASIDALLLTAQYDAALELAQREETPNTATWRPLQAAFELRRGRALADRGDFEAAHTELEDAYLHALEGHASDTAHGSALEMARLFGSLRSEPRPALLWTRLAEVHEHELGDPPLQRAQRLHRQGSLLKQLERFDEAERAYLEALEILTAQLGEGHLLAAQTRNNLGNLYQESSRLDDAIAQYERALEIRERYLGAHHPDVAQTLAGMANTRSIQGRLDEALVLHLRALDIYRSALGQEHALVGLALGNVATVYVDQQKLDEALRYATQSAAIYEHEFGPMSAKTANALNIIGTIHHWSGRLDEARDHYQRARLGLEAAKGPVHGEVANVLFNLALIHQAKGEVPDARLLFERALSIRETVYGPVHLAVAGSLEDYAILEITEGNVDAARTMFARALEIRSELQRADHPRVWNAVENLAQLNTVANTPEQSIQLYDETIVAWSSALGSDDPAVARPRLAKARLQLELGASEAAVETARVALRSVASADEWASVRAEAKFILASALAPTTARLDPQSEAALLALEASRYYATAESQGDEARQVDAWLRARGLDGTR